jgi:hypothetical protein
LSGEWRALAHTIELYLAHLAKRGLRASTIRRASVAIGLAHGHVELERPDRHVRIKTRPLRSFAHCRQWKTDPEGHLAIAGNQRRLPTPRVDVLVDLKSGRSRPET